MRKLHLYQLSEGIPGISKTVGRFFAEAAQICLEKSGHSSGVILNVKGIFNEPVILEWAERIELKERLSWQDEKEATEYGATAIALLLMIHLGNYTFFERVPQNYLGDFFLKKDVISLKSIDDEIYLEISGIFKQGTGNSINGRISKKKIQLENKGISNQNCWIIIIEFSLPLAKISRI